MSEEKNSNIVNGRRASEMIQNKLRNSKILDLLMEKKRNLKSFIIFFI